MPLNVDDVIAHAVYDPVARRERYLKSRQLKGRKPGQLPQPKAGLGSRIIDANAPQSTRHDARGLSANRTKAVQAASTVRQIAEIKGRLNKLYSHLKELLAKKEAESTGQSKKTSSKTSTATKDTSKSPNSQPKTAKQKAAAKESLKKAQEQRAKDQKATPDKVPLTLDEQITRTRAVITDTETKLRAVMTSAQTQTASNGR